MGFLNPINLGWAIALAVLAIIYLRSRSRPTLDVSSLMLFDEAPAPVASVRHVRIDPLFWLEVASLTAMVLAIAGLYAMAPARAGQGRSHALIFDLGAGMSARSNGSSSMERAKKIALDLVDAAPIGDEFSVITYALEAQVAVPQTQNLDSVRDAIRGLNAMAVPTHPSALNAAVMRARGFSDVDLFVDRPPPPRSLAEARSLRVHRMEHGDDNIAVVSMDPGVVDASRGRTVLRNFSVKPRLAEFQIQLDDRELFHQTLMFAPREQMVVPFGPLRGAGLLSARILTPDAIAADNQRWIYSSLDAPGRALVLSPDSSVRDDLARVLLAVNPNLRIETADPAKLRPEQALKPDSKPYDLLVMHDCYMQGIPALATLLIFPPAVAPAGATIPGLSVSREVVSLTVSANRGAAGSESTLLPRSRLISIPEWMDSTATASRSGTYDVAPLAALGRIPGGRIAILACDIRDHLLLDPDRLDALVIAVDLVKRLTTPDNIQIIPTGSFLSVPVSGPAQVTSPDGSTSSIQPDKWGRVRLRPMEAGHYSIHAGGRTVEVYANYFDASESDLASARSTAAAITNSAPASQVTTGPRQVQPLLLILAGLAMIAFVFESVLLMRHAARWGLRHV